MIQFEWMLEQDYVKIKIIQVFEFGLVEMICKCMCELLEYLLCEFCLICQGWGYVKIVEFVCYEIF